MTSPRFQTKIFPASKLGCLLLHSNKTTSVDEFNPFYMIPVNMRVCLNVAKLLPVDDDEADNNLLWSMVTCYDPVNSPVSGTFNGVIASFQEVNSGENSPTLLTEVFGRNEDVSCKEDINVKAVPADPAILKKALEWMRGHEDSSDGALSATELVTKFFSLLQELDIPNASVDYLITFIQSRTWEETHLWGGTMKEFWELVDGIQDDMEKWRILRIFINSNLAWCTRLVFFPVDSLHRTATADMAFNGLVLPGSESKLRERVSLYVKDLFPSDPSIPHLCIKKENGTRTRIDNDISLWYHVPSEMGDSFLLEMQHHSTHTQGTQGKLTSHTVIDLLRIILNHFHSSKKIRYLCHPGNPSEGIEATLCGVVRDAEGSTKDAFRDILIREGLCDADSWLNLSTRIENSKKEWDWKEEPGLSTVYTYVWLEKFSAVAYEILTDITSRFPEFTKIDAKLNLELISKMSLQEFQRMFQNHQGTVYPKEGELNSFRLDADQPRKEPPILKIVGKEGPKLDAIRNDPYKKPTGSSELGNYFPPCLLEFVWLLLYSHFSPSSHDAILKLTKPPTILQAEVSNEQTKDLARRFLRCVIFTISTSHSASAIYWQIGYFPKDRSGNKLVLANKMSRGTQMVFLMLDAIIHTCHYFGNLGFNPKEPSFTQLISNWMEENELSEYMDLAGDAVLMHTFFFIFQVYLQLREYRMEKEKRKLATKFRKIINATLRDVTGLESIICYSKDFKNESWLGNYTLGGRDTLSMAPDPMKLPQLSEMRVPLLQLLGTQSEHDKHPVTHRIGQFASRNISLASFTDEFKTLSNPCKVANASADRVQAPVVAQAQPVSAGGPSNDVTAFAGSAPNPRVSDALNEERGEDNSEMGRFIQELENPPDHIEGLSLSGSSGVQDHRPIDLSSPAHEDEEGKKANNYLPPGGDREQESFQGDLDSSDDDGQQPPDAGAQVVALPLPGSQQPKRKRKGSGKGRKPRKTGGTIPEDGTRAQEVAPTGESVEDTEDQEVSKRKRPKLRVHLGEKAIMDNVSKSLAKIAPPSLVDLSGDSDEEELIKRNVDEMDEDSKNQCLMLFFKFWREKWRKQQKSIQIRNAFFHDEAGCDDSNVSSDETEDEENEYDTNDPFIDTEAPDPPYDPAHPHAFAIGQEPLPRINQPYASAGYASKQLRHQEHPSDSSSEDTVECNDPNSQDGKEPEQSDEDEEGVRGDHDTHQANSAEYNGMNLDDNINFGFQRNHVEEDHGPIDYTIDLEGYLPVAQTENVEEPPDSEPTRKSRKRKTTGYRKKK